MTDKKKTFHKQIPLEQQLAEIELINAVTKFQFFLDWATEKIIKKRPKLELELYNAAKQFTTIYEEKHQQTLGE